MLIGSVKAQTITELFESAVQDASSFTSDAKTFNLTGPFGFTVGNFPGTGYNGSAQYIQAADPTGAYGQTAAISAAAGTFKINSFYFFVSGSPTYVPSVTLGNGPGSITFRGKLAGNTVFTVVRNTTGASTSSALPGNGFTMVDFTTEGGSNNSNQTIDQLEIQLSSNYDYFAIDNFTFTKVSTTVPTVTTNATISNLGAKIVTVGGSNDNGGATILNRGIVWSTSPTPIVDGLGVANVAATNSTGAFTVNVTSLPPGTTIYYRAYAINAAGTGYGDVKSFTTNPALSATQSQTIACNGINNGTATVVPSGGKPPYTYSWSPSGGTGATASGLASTNYTVTITDSEGTSIQKNFTIAQNPPIITGVTITDVSCYGGNNGAIDISPSGGSGSYTYNWGGGITTQDRTNLTAGTYSVTITDTNSCKSTINNITVGQPAAAVNGIAIITNILCNGESTGVINVTPLGGTGPYTFLWNDGVTTQNRTGLPTGTYSVTITDAKGCTKLIDNLTITQPTAISATATITHVTCNGGNTGAINLTPSGGTGPYTFLWNDGVTTEDRIGLTAGTYKVTITDSKGCTKELSYTVTQPNNLLGGTIVPTNVSCKGGANGAIDLTPSGGTPEYTYNWADGPTTQDRTGLTAGTYSVTITDANACTKTISGIVIGEPANVVGGTTVVTNVACNGGNTGAINLTPSGGVGPYTYLWNDGITTEDRTGLIAGVYSVTITDAHGCSKTISNILVTQPITALNASTGGGQTNVSCFGGANGTATVAPTGGTPGYTYSWNTVPIQTTATATGLSAGTYTVTVTDANACSTTKSFTITQPTALNVSTGGGQTNVSCFGGANGTATVAPTGGTPGYTYSWNTVPIQTTATATGLSADTYTVTITDANACQTTKSFTITQPPALVATEGSKSNVSCNGGSNGSATVNVTGGTGSYTYSWSPSGGTGATATGLSVGTYTVTVTDANACQTTKSFTITQPTTLTSTKSQTDVLCNGGSTGTATVVASGGAGSYTYSWAPFGGTASTATGLPVGNYSCTVTDNNGCSITENFTIREPNAISLTASQINVTCNGGTNGSATVTATGGTGALSYSWAPSGGTAKTATGLKAGTYTVTVTDANLCSKTQTLTITEPTALAASITSTNASSATALDGNATVTASGGTAPYSYSWSPSGGKGSTANNLKAGIYSVIITDANGCSITETVTIKAPEIIVSGSFTAFTTVYGSMSTSKSITVTGNNLNDPIILTAPSQFEISSDDVNFSNPLNINTVKNTHSTVIYLRLKNGLSVNSSIEGDLTLKAGTKTTKTVVIPISQVTEANLTVTADPQSKVYGKNDPTLTYNVSGLVNNDKVGDVLTGTLVRVAGEDVGTYAINQGSLVANGNYTLTYIDDKLTINKASLTVTAD
ncbi:beta strand repeat-containing protein, partial [Empedobacter sp. UBA7248]|uniref:beta strand repeat-containing protein n=1 Tax=Empedobacter sp. UBA7248 TaxID=1946448 RepID=UPI0025BF1D16